MSITTIARQAQGMRAGQVIAKLAEEPTSCESTPGSLNHLPSGTATTKPQVAVRTSVATVLDGSYQLTPTVLGQQGGNSAGGDREIVPHRDP
jgi:hypothetical protein